MVDRCFSEPRLAELYDAFSLHRRDFDFYLPLLMSVESVLDVGCGTGELLCMAREAGHAAQLCGLDPATAMLEQARKKRGDIEWVVGDLDSAAWDGEFDLVVMSGHAFQVLVEDEQIRDALASIRTALRAGGRFAFETRNPTARTWEQWVPEHAVEVVHQGQPVTMTHQVHRPVSGELVSFSTTFASPHWYEPLVSQSTLRFLDVVKLRSLLSEAGFVVERQVGDWDGSPLEEASPEIITIARRA